MKTVERASPEGDPACHDGCSLIHLAEAMASTFLAVIMAANFSYAQRAMMAERLDGRVQFAGRSHAGGCGGSGGGA
jgi:hypothetical protein